jgi:hypothetical protein
MGLLQHLRGLFGSRLDKAHLTDSDQRFRDASADVGREDCPPTELLLARLRNPLPFSPSTWLHLTQCWPCYLEVRAFHRKREIGEAENSEGSPTR